jgi:hypothetical protein
MKNFQSGYEGVSKAANSWIIILQLDNYLTANLFLRREDPGSYGKVWLKNFRQGVRGRLKKKFRRSIEIFLCKIGSGFLRNGLNKNDPNRFIIPMIKMV